MGISIIQGKDYEIRAAQMPSDVTDVYISVFFDGTGNNLYEQSHKNEKLRKQLEKKKAPLVLYSLTDSLFLNSTKLNKTLDEFNMHGMEEYSNQRSQSEKDFTISEKRYEVGNIGNGGWKYSNVAILRSLAKNFDAEYSEKNGIKKVGVNYNLYIEGVGRFWDDRNDMIGLGMGTGRTGVVGLVSKAVTFVSDFLNSFIPKDRRPEVLLHFAVFGFSRGSACARLFSFLMVDEPENLGSIAKKEFRHYLPQSYWENENENFLVLKEYDIKKRTVDFLGIFDTVSSIGFLRKEDTTTNYGVNRFGKKWFGKDKENVNHLHGLFRVAKSDAANNWHSDNVSNYGLYSPQNERVRHTFHICAMDEFRENFALVDLGTELSRCTEVFIPGCHSDIGGGYMNEDEIDRYTLRRKIHGEPAKMIANNDPRNPIPSSNLSQSVLRELGWFDRTTKKKKEEFSLAGIDENGNPTETTKEQTTYIYEVDDKVEFERFVKEGYSNITLSMMKKVATCKLKKENWPKQFLPFKDNDTLPARFNIPEDSILSSIISECNNVIKECCSCKGAEGKRIWICPSMEEYVKIRRKYIHFTCTDELNIEKLHFKASGANLGNPPNWRRLKDNSYLLCRLIYKGNKGENKLHYMDEEYLAK